MGLLSRSDHKITASDVQKDYDNRIERFLRQIGESGGNRFWARDDPLDTLFAWGLKTREKLRDTDQQLASSISDWREEKIKNQKGEKARKELLRANEELREELQRAHADTARLQEWINNKLESLTIEHSANLAEKDDQMRHREDAHKNERDRLVGQLLADNAQSSAWPDDVLRHNFQELQRLVKSILSPSRPEFLVPQGTLVSKALDPTGYIQQHGVGRAHYWFKSVLWEVLQDHFFGTSFGFGAFGQDKAQSELFEAFSTWQKLFQADESLGPMNVPHLTIFEGNRLANLWRTTTFKAMGEASNEQTGDRNCPIFKLRAENVASAESRIIQFLSDVAALSHNTVPPEVKQEIGEALKTAGEIGLQFGIHPAQLELILPQQPVRGDPSPGIQKIGDGKENRSSMHVIVPCSGKRLER